MKIIILILMGLILFSFIIFMFFMSYIIFETAEDMRERERSLE